MESKFNYTLLLLTAMIAFTGCTNDKNEKPPQVVIHADDGMKAEELAEAGEALVSPYTFMLADRVFTMALAKDPENRPDRKISDQFRS